MERLLQPARNAETMPDDHVGQIVGQNTGSGCLAGSVSARVSSCSACQWLSGDYRARSTIATRLDPPGRGLQPEVVRSREARHLSDARPRASLPSRRVAAPPQPAPASLPLSNQAVLRALSQER